MRWPGIEGVLGNQTRSHRQSGCLEAPVAVDILTNQFTSTGPYETFWLPGGRSS